MYPSLPFLCQEKLAKERLSILSTGTNDNEKEEDGISTPPLQRSPLVARSTRSSAQGPLYDIVEFPEGVLDPEDGQGGQLFRPSQPPMYPQPRNRANRFSSTQAKVCGAWLLSDVAVLRNTSGQNAQPFYVSGLTPFFPILM